MFSTCMYFDFVVLVISRFGFEGWVLVLFASVPGLCIRFTFRWVYVISCTFALNIDYGCS